MRIAVFGASGATGKQIVSQALSQNDRVYAFVRNPEEFPIHHENLEIIKADIMKTDGLAELLPTDTEAVLVALGAPPNEKLPIRSMGTNNIIHAMKENNIARIVCMTTLGMGKTMDMLPASMKNFVIPMFLKSAFEDHKVQEEEVEKSGLEWTLVRPSNLQNGELTQNYQYGTENSSAIKGKVSRADVANFMLKCAHDPATIDKKYWVSD